MTRSRTCVVIFAMLVAVAVGAPALAQVSRGTISGVVRDSSGTGLPGVTITAANQASRASQSTTTGSDGSYTLSLAPGAYAVTASLPGFRRMTQVVEIGGGGTRQFDFSIEVALSEEVTVTAMKREETLLNMPFSVAAPTEEVLRERGVENLEGVAANVAGFTVQNLGPGQSQVAMRGVSAGQIVRDQPGVKEQVGVYLDESVISLSLFTPDIDLFDIERVEVLRGPQGTLFGSGSLSGTVRYITNQPELGVTNGFGELGGSTVQRRQPGRQRQGSASTCRSATRRRCASPATTTACPGYIDAVQPDRERQGRRQRRRRTRRARGRQARPERAPDHHAAHRLPEGRAWTAGTASTSTTSSPTRTPRRGRR